MLTNKEKLHSKDKPLADLAIKTVEKCRSAYALVYSMLPEQVIALIKGNEQPLLQSFIMGKSHLEITTLR